MQCCCPWLTQTKELRQCSCQENLPDGPLLKEWGTWFKIALDGSFASSTVFFGAIQCWAFYCSEDFVYCDNSSSDFTNKNVFMQRSLKSLLQLSGVVLLLSIAVTCVLRPVSTQTNWPQTTCLLRTHALVLQTELWYWIMLPVEKYYGKLHCPSASHEIIPTLLTVSPEIMPPLLPNERRRHYLRWNGFETKAALVPNRAPKKCSVLK